MGNNGHFYRHPLHGKRVPSPTGIIGQLDKSGALTWWAAGCACDYIAQQLPDKETYSKEEIFSMLERARREFRNVSQQALDIGSTVHNYIRYYLETGKEPVISDDQVLSAFIAFLEWKDQHKLEVIKTEHTVYDKEGLYAGTLDLLCRLDGKVYVVDFKTTKKPSGNRPYEEWAYQLAAYSKCVEGVEGMGILRLDKETGYPDWYDLTDQRKQAEKIFMCLLKLWYLRHPGYPK